jgi:hypothetical protein
MMSAGNYLMMFITLFSVFLLISCGSGGGGSDSSQNARTHTSIAGVQYSTDSSSQNPLIGTWVNGGYNLTFNPDNTYVRDFNLDGIPAILGSLKVSGNVIIVTDDIGGRYSCIDSSTGEVVNGSYTYDLRGSTLTFNLFHDPCNDRAAFFGLVYTR